MPSYDDIYPTGPNTLPLLDDLMDMEQSYDHMFQQPTDEHNTLVKCPICLTLHEPMDEHEDGDGEGDRRVVSSQEHKCSHGATMIFFELHQCPVCMEEKIQPAIALPCGHGLCPCDFKQIGGRIGGKVKDKEDLEENCSQLSSCPCLYCTLQRRSRVFYQRLAYRDQERNRNMDQNNDIVISSGYLSRNPPPFYGTALSAS